MSLKVSANWNPPLHMVIADADKMMRLVLVEGLAGLKEIHGWGIEFDMVAEVGHV